MDHLNSDLDHNSLGVFQRQLSDMLQSYQQLEHTEQPVAYTMLQSTLNGLQRSTLGGIQRSTIDSLQRSTLDKPQRSTIDGFQSSTFDGPPTGRSSPPPVFPVLSSTRHLDCELAAARAPEAAGCGVSDSLQNSSPAHPHDLLYHPQKQLVQPEDFGVSCRSLVKDFVMSDASAEQAAVREIEVASSSVPAVFTGLKIPQVNAVSVVSASERREPTAVADDDVTGGVLQQSADCPVQASLVSREEDRGSGSSAGDVPSSAASGLSAGDLPSFVPRDVSACGVPSSAASGVSASNVPSLAVSGMNVGNVPSSAVSGVNVGDMSSLASSDVNAGNVPSSEDTRRRYVCPLPECNAERSHRKALVSHVRWEHTLSPLSCRNCRQQQATYAHHLYHSKHCYKGSNALTCGECGASFSLRLTYRRHMQGHAANNCSRCGLRLSSRKALVKHLRVQHGVRESERWFPCPECPRRFMKKHSLIYHSKVHATADTTQCERCGLTLARTALATHMLQAHARQDAYRCSVCHKSFSRNQQYQQHRKLHERYTCATCGGSFASRLDYRRHISQTQPPHQDQLQLSGGAANSCATAAPAAAVDTGTRPPATSTTVRPPVRYLCQVCGATFWSPTRLSHHLKHHDTACLQCCRCGTDYTSAAELHRHLRRSMCARTPARLLCQHCGTHFTAHFLLRRHLLRSAQDGCSGTTDPSAANSVAMETDDVVQTAATSPPPGELDLSTDVTSPVAVETDAPPPPQQHLCEHCGYSCSSRSNLLRHVAAHWRQSRRRYVCDQCAAAFYTLSSLKDHQRYMHTVERTHVCRHCMKTFKTASSLNRHERSHSQQRPYQCFCGQDYKRMSHLRRHMEMTHQMRTKTRLVESLVEAHQPPQDHQHEAEEAVVERGRPEEEEAEGVVRVYSGDLREEDFTLPEGVYTTDTLMMPDGSRSIVLNPVQLPEDQQRLASHQLQQHHMMVLPVEQAANAAAQPHLRHHQAVLTDHHHALDMVITQPHQATEFMPAVIDGGQIALSGEFERDIEGAAVSHSYNQPSDGKDEPRPQRTSVVIRSLPPASSIRVHQ